MKVQLEKSFPLAARADDAWALLQDVAAVAGCMPGARITERVDDSHYKGTVAIRLGPASLSFRGDVEVKEVDPAARSLRLLGRGTDNTGTSGAAMDLHARVEATDAASCVLVGTSEVSVSGKAASFGGRLMSGVADQLLQQFVANLAQRLPQVPPAAAAIAQPAPAPVEAAPTPAEPAPREINGLALLWAMVRDWFHHLFAARRA
jgi:carbon monoxide dehydrogenase subunit G